MLIAALILFGAGANAQAGWLYVIGAAFVGATAAGLIVPAAAIRKLKVSRRVPGFANAGEPLNVVLEVRNDGRADKGPVVVTDLLLGAEKMVFPKLRGGSGQEVAYQSSSPPRGWYARGEVEISSGAPFGIGFARKVIDTDASLLVHPRWVQLSSFPLLESASSPNEVLHERTKRGAGMEFYGLREYRSGDSPRHIHWRSTAKGTALLVREFEEQLASRLSIIVDSLEDIGSGARSSFEDSCSIAASLVVYSLEAGHPVQLFSDGSAETTHLFEPGKVEALDWLAKLAPKKGRSLSGLSQEAVAQMYRRSTAVMIFPSTQKNQRDAVEAASILQSASSRVIAILSSAGGYVSGRDSRVMRDEEEERLIAELHAQRVIVYRVESKRDLEDCLREPYLA